MERIASRLDAQLKDLIRHAREAAGLSQRALADLVDVTGSTVQKYEDGSLKVSLETLRAIAAATGFEFAWFLERAGYLSAGATPKPSLEDSLRAIASHVASLESRLRLANALARHGIALDDLREGYDEALIWEALKSGSPRAINLLRGLLKEPDGGQSSHERETG